ncbi:MAG: hypothetical protein IKV05_00015 [Bacteroidales bacterium]|nr:hypothetical protein [Bacteroidales bacterium]
MKNFFNVLLLLLIPLLWNCAFIKWCIETRYDAPLTEAVIPESTLAFLDSLSKRLLSGDDHLVLHRVDSINVDSWNNDHDFGRRDSNGFYVYEEDTMFVIYSDKNDSELLAKTLEYARSAVRPLEQVMGQYYYPYMVNGRKLPLYLCTDEDNYQYACRSLCNDEDDYSNTWGLCVQSYCGYDVLAQGITLNYGSMSRISRDPDLDLKATIWHEMNHYVYFQSIDLSKEITMHTWMYEGLAEYFSSNVKRQTTSLDSVEKKAVYTNTLEASFDPFLFNYSGGELFYEYLKATYGERVVLDFIQDIYTQPLSSALTELGSGMDKARQGWVGYIEKHYI